MNNHDGSNSENAEPGSSSNVRADSVEFRDGKESSIRKLFETDPAKACEQLYDHYFQILCSHANRYVCASGMARDIVNDIFVTFWEKRIYTYITTSYRAYLFVAVRNRCLKAISKEFRQTNITLDFDDRSLAATLPSPEEILQFNDLRLAIETTIQRLSPQCRKVFLLSRNDGKTYVEIASELNISVKAVEAHVSKALSSLRRVLQSEWHWFLLFAWLS